MIGPLRVFLPCLLPLPVDGRGQMRPDHFDTGAGDYIGDRLDYNHREMVIDSTYVSPFAVTMKGQQAEEYE